MKLAKKLLVVLEDRFNGSLSRLISAVGTDGKAGIVPSGRDILKSFSARDVTSVGSPINNTLSEFIAGINSIGKLVKGKKQFSDVSSKSRSVILNILGDSGTDMKKFKALASSTKGIDSTLKTTINKFIKDYEGFIEDVIPDIIKALSIK